MEKLQAAYAERLVSVVLYGSAATGEHHARVLRLQRALRAHGNHGRASCGQRGIFRWWREQGSPAPLLLTENEMARSTDCFAIEFLDIKRQHVLLYGKDVISGLEVDGRSTARRWSTTCGPNCCACAKRLRHAFRSGPAAPPAARFAFDVLRAVPPRACSCTANEAPLRKREVVQSRRRAFRLRPASFQKLLDVREERLKPREAERSACLRHICGASPPSSTPWTGWRNEIHVKRAWIVIGVVVLLAVIAGGEFVSVRNDLVRQREPSTPNGPTWKPRCSGAPTSSPTSWPP